jgi:hypothetical protein
MPTKSSIVEVTVEIVVEDKNVIKHEVIDWSLM